MSILKPLDQIKEEDIKNLIVNCAREQRTIEYKEGLPGGSDEDKREFLADVSSFANASGGDLIYGIKEKRDASGATTGEPESIKPLTVNPDTETRRLEQIIQAGIEPRMPGVHVLFASLSAGGHIAVIRIPKSWAGLHMVTFKNLSRFFSRNSGGKYQLDVSEIRTGFVAAESGLDRIRRFRLERVAKILSNEGPVYMENGAKAILHLVPLSSLDSGNECDFQDLPANEPQAIATSGYGREYNFDGLVSHTARGREPASSYIQIFRNGAIESCAGQLFDDHKKFVASLLFERKLIEATRSYLGALKTLRIPEPALLFLSVAGIQGYTMAVPSDYFVYDPVRIREESLLCPEIRIESFDDDPAVILHSTFNRIWNAVGIERSMYYDATGKWIGHR